jgi:hypothetical protein
MTGRPEMSDDEITAMAVRSRLMRELDRREAARRNRKRPGGDAAPLLPAPDDTSRPPKGNTDAATTTA